MKKIFLLSAALVAAGAMFAQDAPEMYVIGSNVNGVSWTEGDPGGKMTAIGDGVYEWDGNLGTGFKFNDGSWAGSYNLGSSKKYSLGQTLILDNDGGSGNINFDGFTMLRNAHVVLNINDLSLVCTGEMEGKIQWFLVGDFNGWAISADAEGAIVFDETEDAGIYVKAGLEFTATENFKISSTGWGEQYGETDKSGEIQWGVSNETAEGVYASNLFPCGSEGVMANYLYGTYDAVLDLNVETDGEKTPNLQLSESTGGNVNAIEAANGQATYFNLQGVRVNEPAGLCIKVLNGKTSKVVVR